MDLFDLQRQKLMEKNAPLADRMRPRILDEFIGQDHIIGHGRLLRRAIQIDQLSSLIFYGPPGTGKTTLARIIANTTKSQFLSINAVLAGVKEIRDAIEQANTALSLYGKRTILFVDEVHRFNKAQQDALLPHVENGTLILIGATTENPYFEVNKALVSRSRIFQLKLLTQDDLKKVALQAIRDPDRGYGKRSLHIDDDAMDHLIHVAHGDARGVLNALELAIETTACDSEGNIHITRTIIEDSIQQKAVLYDKDGDAHYDAISAFIKSVRGSDPDAALYWMAKMLYAGEDPRFIFRRMIILASEDIGLADPNALPIVVAAAQAYDYIGLPEGRFPLAEACLYLSTAPKSNTTLSFFDAIAAVSSEEKDEVPNHLKDSSRDKEGFGHGEGYLYPHAFRDHWVAQQYLPDGLQGKLFYNPTDQGYEKNIRSQVARRREAHLEAMVDREDTDLFASGARDTGMSAGESWQHRSASTGAKVLDAVRDQIFSMAKPARDELVLDAGAKTGLLTYEAIRHVPEGEVWAAVFEENAYQTMVAMARNLEAVQRPQIVKTTLESMQADIAQSAQGAVLFDAIIARNLLQKQTDKRASVRALFQSLDNKGRIVLSEVIHRDSQRLSEYGILRKKELQDIFTHAENDLVNDADNPMVNWDGLTLKKMLAEEGFKVDLLEKEFLQIRRITRADISFWLRESLPGQRRSLGDRLREKSTAGFYEEIVYAMQQLAFREVSWKTRIGFFHIRGKSKKIKGGDRDVQGLTTR